MMQQATLIYQAPNAVQAKQRFQEWSEQWQEDAPKAVATLERDFEQTGVYYQLETVTREWIRTTSLLERTNRELRRKCALGSYLRQSAGYRRRRVPASPTAPCSMDEGFLVAGFS